MSEDVVNLSRFRADLSRALARHGKRLLESDDLAEQVPQLAPLEAYFAVKELGVDEAVPILRHCSREQWQIFIDLDCWRDERPDPLELDAWLAPFAAQSPELLVDAFLQLDEQLQVLFLASQLNIYDARSDAIPEAPKSVTRATTPDDFFVLEPLPSREREVEPLALVNALYAHDQQLAFRILTAAKWELLAPLEEEAYRFRSGRLEDLGFPATERAQSIFASPPQRPRTSPSQTPPPPETSLPAAYAAPLTESTLLARAMAHVDDPRLVEHIEGDLLHLINSAVIAYGEAPGDLRQVTEIACRVRDTLSLGLEQLLSPETPLADAGDEQVARQAARLLAEWPLRDVFAHGHHTVLPVARAASALARDPVVGNWLEGVETEADDYSQDRADRAFLRALASPHPLHAGRDLMRPDSSNAFASKSELEAAEKRLDALAERFR